MATRRRMGRPQTQRYYTNEYINGNTVRKLDREYSGQRSNLAVVPNREPYRRPDRNPERRKKPSVNPAQYTSWDLTSLLFMVAALCVTMYVCVSYLQVQHDVVIMDKTIASMESEILELRNKNDAAYSKVDTSVDLAYIYKVATKELGMVHPVENQVFSYKNQKSDYVRQYSDIPEAKE